MTQIKRAVLAMAAAIALGMGMAATATAAGPKLADDRVEAFSADRYVVTFKGHEPAVVVLRGDGDTHLDLYVFDENGNQIAADEDGDAISAVRWTPKWTGKFTIKVVNRGSVYNHYILGAD